MEARVNRRRLLCGGIAGIGGTLAVSAGRAADAAIEVIPDEPIGTIAPEIYGHFVEHLGGVVYDGIWVGERSKIPNILGIRTELVEHMRRIGPAVIRYPGGCFADSYNWLDGTGPRGKRPRRANFWADDPGLRRLGAVPQRFEPNAFGTNEFLRFCRLVEGQPYLAANLRSLPAQSFSDWVEYCNAPAGSTTLAELRARGELGSREPFGVRFWGVGNESWGCGGNFLPGEYAVEFRRFTAAVPRFDTNLAFIAAGPSSGDLNWTRGFFSKMAEKGQGAFNSVWGWGLHHYSWNVSKGATTDWVAGKGDALRYDVEGWYELLRQGDQMDSLIQRTWAAMGEFDRGRRVKLAVDEWGAWHRSGSEAAPAHLFGQMSTIRDALLAALTLDTFNRHADKVAMSNIAQLINCLHSLFLAHEDKFVATPNFHVYEMYLPHQGARAVRAAFSCPEVSHPRAGRPATFWGLNGSASVRGGRLTLTVVNPHAAEPREATISVRGAAIRSCRARILASGGIHGHNTFAEPRAVIPRDEDVAPRGREIVFRFPPASVTRLSCELA